MREGLEVLLVGWGARCVSFASGSPPTRWAQSEEAASIKPSLIVADYRLGNGETGVEAIAALRRRFGADVPAIVVTGSSMTGHDKEAWSTTSTCSSSPSCRTSCGR